MSADGTRVAFAQFSPQFGFGMTGPAQVFVRDLAAASTTLASRTPSGAVADSAEQPSLSADGTRVSFTTNFDQLPMIPQVFIRNLSAATPNARVGRPRRRRPRSPRRARLEPQRQRRLRRVQLELR